TMITRFVALYSLLCLCTTVTSDTKKLQVKTVKHGEIVVMKCNLSGIKVKKNLVWYRQSLDDVPLVFVRHYGQKNYTFVEGFTDKRFSVTVNDHQFDLNINGIREDDGGEYFCGYVEGSTVKFTSGTRLQFEGEEKKLCPTPGTLNKNTHSVTHQGSNSSDGEAWDFCKETKYGTMITRFVALYSLLCLCTTGSTSDSKGLHMKTVKRGGDVTVECTGFKNKTNIVWYRQMSGEMPQFFAKYYRNAQGYTFADGFTDKRFSFTVNDQKFDLNIKEIIEEDKGEYFCGELDGSNVKFTSGTRLQFE
ncbi:putative immune-type receptor 7 precursor, partial [Clarias magur]